MGCSTPPNQAFTPPPPWPSSPLDSFIVQGGRVQAWWDRLHVIFKLFALPATVLYVVVLSQEHPPSPSPFSVCWTGTLGGERPMGTTAYGWKGFKERTWVSGGRPIGAASCRQQSTAGVVPPPPPSWQHHHPLAKRALLFVTPLSNRGVARRPMGRALLVVAQGGGPGYPWRARRVCCTPPPPGTNEAR